MLRSPVSLGMKRHHSKLWRRHIAEWTMQNSTCWSKWHDEGLHACMPFPSYLASQARHLETMIAGLQTNVEEGICPQFLFGYLACPKWREKWHRNGGPIFFPEPSSPSPRDVQDLGECFIEWCDPFWRFLGERSVCISQQVFWPTL